MKTQSEMVKELRAAKEQGVKFVTYGESDLGMPIEIDVAICDIQAMDAELIGGGVWYECEVS